MKSSILATIAAVALALTACSSDSGSSGSSSDTANSYATTSTKGDYAQWTMNGNTLSADWKMVSSTGVITKTLNISATCGTADATYGFRICTVSTGSCTDGTTTCATNDAPAAGAQFYAFEVPGLALFVQAVDGHSNEQLHVGFKLNTTCPTDSVTTTDHTFLHMSVAQKDVFGVFRSTPTFSSILHADFGMGHSTCNGSTNTGNCTETPTISYNTGNGTGSGAETPTNFACTNGVRTFDLGSDHVRAMKSESGAFILDLPSGQGGLVAFPTSMAATTADFASANFGGITFPDNGSPVLISVATGALSSSAVPISSVSFYNSAGSLFTNANIHAANSTSGLSAPAYPNFTSAVANYTSNNALHSTYATPANIPGLFVIDGTAAGDAGRVMLMAMKVNGKILAFGSVYNWRNNQYGYSGADYVNSGAFILFQK